MTTQDRAAPDSTVESGAATGQPVTKEILEEVFVHSRGEMVGYARRRISGTNLFGVDGDPEDVVQEAFLRLLADPKVLTTPRAYLYAVIRGEIAARVRARSERHRLESQRVADPTRFDAQRFEDAHDLTANRLAVRQYLDDLSPRQREGVWLTKALDMKAHEAAAVTGTNPKTLAVHVKRAVKILKSQLGTVICALLGPGVLAQTPAAK
ncbi:RNA polymerase sigma factor [Streptomyces virginiae]|uniref:RNA polymerase sigma factor n=1 Tax=Streptomyces virginiae TaxID=1961 RepID=UPI00341ADA50